MKINYAEGITLIAWILLSVFGVLMTLFSILIAEWVSPAFIVYNEYIGTSKFHYRLVFLSMGLVFLGAGLFVGGLWVFHILRKSIDNSPNSEINRDTH